LGFLRRLLGGSADPVAPEADPVDPDTADSEERAREIEVLRDEQDRLDELTRRQLRYADHAWTPPAEGGERRAEDADTDASADRS
jgi:hypothetical protein